MSCRKIVLVFCMLTSTLDASPWLPRRYLYTPPVATRLVQTYIRPEIINLIAEDPAEIITATISPVDEHTIAQIKIPILHKTSKDTTDLLVQPLELKELVFSGVNNWFILDDFYNQRDIDEEFYECYEEALEDLSEEDDLDYDIDRWEYERYICG